MAYKQVYKQVSKYAMDLAIGYIGRNHSINLFSILKSKFLVFISQILLFPLGGQQRGDPSSHQSSS